MPIIPMCSSSTLSSELLARSDNHNAAASISSVTVAVISNRDSSGMSGVATVSPDAASWRARFMRRGSSMPSWMEPGDEKHHPSRPAARHVKSPGHSGFRAGARCRFDLDRAFRDFTGRNVCGRPNHSLHLGGSNHERRRLSGTAERGTRYRSSAPIARTNASRRRLLMKRMLHCESRQGRREGRKAWRERHKPRLSCLSCPSSPSRQ